MASEFEKIPYYDLLLESREGRLPEVLGREADIDRVLRVITRRYSHHVIICSPSGTGKTNLVFALAMFLSKLQSSPIESMVMPDSSYLSRINANSSSTYIDAFTSIEKSILVIDGFGELACGQAQLAATWSSILKPVMEKQDVSVILTIQPEELAWLEANRSHFVKRFEVINLKPLPADSLELIFNNIASALLPAGIKLEAGAISAVIELCGRFPALGEQPKSGIELIDEAVAQIKLSSEPVKFNRELITDLVSSKTGVPTGQLKMNEVKSTLQLPEKLKGRVIGQDQAVGVIAKILQRAKLGLRNENRPLGSFLALGPSGVGKTETAKALADLIYGDKHAFLRIDMSEFSQEHTVARLLGAPAGFVGFESGGQLTKHLAKHPYSLVLLDEIEKAHPKIFDIFLQILDDGRITSARGEIIDARSAVFIATSNLGVDKIAMAAIDGRDVSSDEFIKNDLLPDILNFLRPEFVNRFDQLVVFKPLSLDALVQIAFKEMRAIEERFKGQGVEFSIPIELLVEQIERVYDPRFGARPVKRLVEQVCEEALSELVLGGANA